MSHLNEKYKINKNVVRPSLVALAVAQAMVVHQSQAATIQTGRGCNLANAIISANNDQAPVGSLCTDGSGADTIEMNGGVRLTTATAGASGLPVITSAITINGNNRVIRRDLNADPFRILDVNTTQSVTVNNLTIRDGLLTDSAELGAGLLVRQVDKIDLNNVTISNNSAVSGGGGIALRAAVEINISESSITHNSSGGAGGGVFSEGQSFNSDTPYVDENGQGFRDYYSQPTVMVSQSTISDNSADIGGGIYVPTFHTLTVTDSSLTGNIAEKEGGAIYSVSNTKIQDSTISQNIAAAGGGIFEQAFNNNYSANFSFDNRGNALYIDGSVFSNNVAESGDGGAINAAERRRVSSGVAISDSVISGNTAAGSGGGVSVVGSYYLFSSTINFSINTTIIRDNLAGEHGGAINAPQTLGIRLEDVQVIGNSAVLRGGGIRMNSSPSQSGGVFLSRSVLSGNSTDGSGGAIYANDRRSSYCNLYDPSCYSYGTRNDPIGVTVATRDTTISGNSAAENGGAIAVFTRNAGALSELTLRSTTVTGNSASVGGGIFSAGAQLELSNSILAGNVADRRGSEITRNRQAPSPVIDGRNVLGSSEQSNAQAFNNFDPDSNDITATNNGSQPTPLSQIIEPLRDNGGDTLTHALVANSPAIDNGLQADCSINGRLTDQRNLLRTDGACDIGAYELFSQNVGFSVSASNAIEGVDANVIFRVELSEPQAVSVGYDFRTEAVTAIEGEDYVGRTGRIIFPAGATVRERRVSILEDGISNEPAETFNLIVTDINDPTLEVSTQATIFEDAILPVVSANAVRVEEGSQRAVVEITLSEPSTEEVRVSFATFSPQSANNPADDGEDYIGRSGVIVFAPGQTRRTRSITLVDDNVAEPNELFRLDLSDAVNAIISSDSEQVRVFILNDD